MATKKPLEKEIQAAILDYLAWNSKQKDYMFWRQNTGGIWDKDHFRAMPKYSMKGVPDICVIKDGFFIGLEVKRKGGKQSDDQKIFENEVKAKGAEYYIISGIEDVKNIGL